VQQNSLRILEEERNSLGSNREIPSDPEWITHQQRDSPPSCKDTIVDSFSFLARILTAFVLSALIGSAIGCFLTADNKIEHEE